MAPYRYNAPLPRKVQSPARKPYSPASKRSPFTSSRARNTARKTAGTPDYVFSRRDNYVAVSDRERHRERHPARPQSPDHRRLRFTRDSLLLDETETEEVEDDESEPMLFFWEDEKTLVSDMLHNG
ncbi:hypothetical protein VNI00_003109 [Paramarasmius palmivorus]|uniref:Uncharacterized protein n=1 Tax=Paramarasmius palmivorus TaxID=297713 RepID=A0AAW0DP75_9AGAR